MKVDIEIDTETVPDYYIEYLEDKEEEMIEENLPWYDLKIGKMLLKYWENLGRKYMRIRGYTVGYERFTEEVEETTKNPFNEFLESETETWERKGTVMQFVKKQGNQIELLAERTIYDNEIILSQPHVNCRCDV